MEFCRVVSVFQSGNQILNFVFAENGFKEILFYSGLGVSDIVPYPLFQFWGALQEHSRVLAILRDRWDIMD